MWVRSLVLAALVGAATAPDVRAADLSRSRHSYRHTAYTKARVTDAISPTTWIYGLCTFPTPEGLDRTCSTRHECSGPGERWQAGCWFR